LAFVLRDASITAGFGWNSYNAILLAIWPLPSKGTLPMDVLVLDTAAIRQLKRDRAQSRVDRFDEVWNGVYVVGPNRDNEHQFLVSQIACSVSSAIERPAAATMIAGCYVSDRRAGWRRNYRCPDVAVFLRGNPNSTFISRSAFGSC
jgi:hypothetical protein